LPNLFLVGASAGYPSVPGVIGNGMNVVELITRKSVRERLPEKTAETPVQI
jgi:phytoene dehydrogenase-like protein